MDKNMSKQDSMIRYGLAAVFIVLGFMYSWFFYLLAAIMLATAYVNFCPIYKALGMSTRKKDE